jgi:hypothetical protein
MQFPIKVNQSLTQLTNIKAISMNTLRRTFPLRVIFLTLLIACKDPKTSQEQITAAPENTPTIQPEADSIAKATDPILSDTIGLYKLNNAEARIYIIDMNRILSDIDKAIDENAPNRMPALLGKQRELQQKQLTIQSALPEADRTLFKIYVNKVADRLANIATRLENM